MALQALIFDVDGTLAETERDGHRVAFNQAFDEAGFDWNWSGEFYGELLKVTGGKERLRYYLKTYQPDFEPAQDLDDFIINLHERKNYYHQQRLASGIIPLRPGVKRLIEEARNKGLRLAIATTSDVPNVMALLEKRLDPEWFEVIAGGDMVSQKKPAPDIYNYTLSQLSLTASECLVFEDSQAGLMAATQAGLKTIVTVNDYTQNEDFSDAILVLSHLGEPDQPLTVISGQLKDVSYLDLNALNQLNL